jgi:bifunctional DNA-binding transcriptional regulator/antitoxin component of YhaV-PrlF toxin-antitoxin module
MGEIIIRPITSDGKITIPKELIEKFDLKNNVEIEETLCNKGILIRKHD